MKKIILSGAAFAFFAATLVSCGESKEATTETTTTETTTTTEPAATETATTAPVASDAPTFSSEEVNKGLAEFKALKDDYIKALESKDQAKISEFTTKYTAWAQSAATWASKLKPEETQAYSEYMTKISQEWAAAAQAAVK